MSSINVKRTFETYWKKANKIFELVILFLELHMAKIVLLAAVFLCIYDKCGLFFGVSLIIVLAFTIGGGMQTFAILATSIFVSLVLLARMVYQIDYIRHEMWNVTCDVHFSTAFQLT